MKSSSAGFAIASPSAKCTIFGRFTYSKRTGSPRLPRKSRPLRPTRPSDTGRLGLSARNALTALITLVLKLPQRPRSAVIAITIVGPVRPLGRLASSGLIAGSTRAAMLARTWRTTLPNGRVAITRSCARRSFDAATIFIAFVICCVFLTARIRRRRSISDGICHDRSRGARRAVWSAKSASAAAGLGGRRLSGGEVRRKLLHHRVELALQLIVEGLFLGDS